MLDLKCGSCGAKTTTFMYVEENGKVKEVCHNCYHPTSHTSVGCGHIYGNNKHNKKMSNMDIAHIESRRLMPDGQITYPERFRTSSHR